MESALFNKIQCRLGDGKINTVRLILGDQLNAQHSWFKTRDQHVAYLIAESHDEATYARHHSQKVAAFFAAMQNFAAALEQAGHTVIHLTLDDTQGYAGIADIVSEVCEFSNTEYFDYQQPDELRLHNQLATLSLSCHKKIYSTEHFMLETQDFAHYIKPGKHNRMESFYRKLRKRFNILMDGDTPEGGEWNYDNENRASLKKSDLQNIPAPLCFANDVTEINQRIARHAIATIGQTSNHLLWPVNRQQAREILNFFCQNGLPNFGRFQDAMTANHEHRWSLYHSRLSFALNTKMLSPRMVIEHALQAYKTAELAITLPQVEGFVRQILGWREYVRAVYWQNGENYHEQNVLNANRTLPSYFWSGRTKMLCMANAIEQSLDKAYAHHIQRLMITGNFCLLAGIAPSEVDEWYLGIYIDALEWVELPNTRGMSQWADGGWVATKPYCSGGNYINKMSDYCKSCHYDVKQKTGEGSCPFNSLYWDFVDRHKQRFERNPRMAMIYKNWQKQPKQNQQAILAQAKAYLSNIESL